MDPAEEALDATIGIEDGDPIRIFVQTATHLVPGDIAEKVERMRNIICQHHWRRDFDPRRDRCYVHGGDFARDHRVCYFLLDTGSTASRWENPPIIRYQWDGESLVYIRRSLPAHVLVKLREYPFMREPIKARESRKHLASPS